MALIKSITNPATGQAASYWRPISFAFDILTQRGVAVFGGYVDASFRLALLKPTHEIRIDFTPAMFVEMAAALADGQTNFDVIARALYAVARAVPEFDGATQD